MTYPMKVFDLKNIDLAIAVAKEVKFSTLIFSNNNKTEVIHLPVIVNQQNNVITLEGHLWKNNPLLEVLTDPTLSTPCKIIFNGADGYISANIYDEKPKTGRVAPTWNYVAVHFDGQIQTVDHHGLQNILSRQTAEFESMVGSSWRVEHVPPEYTEQLKKRIVGFKFTVDSFKIIAKMGQNELEDVRNMIAWGARRDERKKDMVSWYDLIYNFNNNPQLVPETNITL